MNSDVQNPTPTLMVTASEGDVLKAGALRESSPSDIPYKDTETASTSDENVVHTLEKDVDPRMIAALAKMGLRIAPHKANNNSSEKADIVEYDDDKLEIPSFLRREALPVVLNDELGIEAEIEYEIERLLKEINTELRLLNTQVSSFNR